MRCESNAKLNAGFRQSDFCVRAIFSRKSKFSIGSTFLNTLISNYVSKIVRRYWRKYFFKEFFTRSANWRRRVYPSTHLLSRFMVEKGRSIQQILINFVIMYLDIFNHTQQIQHTLECYANGDLSYKGTFVLISVGRFIFIYLFTVHYMTLSAHIIQGLVPKGRMHNKA